MKILLVHKFWYLRGGAETAVLATKKLLEQAGHTVEVFGMKHPQNLFENKYFVDFVDYAKLNFFEKIKFGLRAIYNFQAKNNFKQLLKEFKPDVVHLHGIGHQLSCSVIDAAKEYGARICMTLHDYYWLSPNYNLFHHGRICEESKNGCYARCLLDNCLENYGESLVATAEAYLKKWENWSADIDVFIAPSKFVYTKSIQYGLDENKIQELAYPVDASQWPLITRDGDQVVFFGRLSAEKGVGTLLQAAGLNPDIPFTIIGDGPDRKKLETQAQKLSLNNVSFIGFKSGRELYNHLAKARIVVVPSVWYEVSGLTILEAQAMGKIVLGSKIGAIPESLSSDCLFEPNDAVALAKLLKKWYNCPLTQRQAMGERLRDRALSKHRPERYLEKLLNIYRRG